MNALEGKKGLLSPTLSSKGGEGDEPRAEIHGAIQSL
jgi:hypothetical protein